MTLGSGTDVNPRDGDRVKIEVDLAGGVVAEARVVQSGCEVSTKAAAALARLARGQSQGDVLGYDVPLVTTQLGRLDEEQERCVAVAIGALRNAIVSAHTRTSA
ncbi:MAG TPA: iron-sulfur cluster assembly scaffold protein [Candidatus Limnocylindria bacterium]